MKDRNDTRYAGPRVGSPPWLHLAVVTSAGTGAILVAAVRLRGAGVLVRHPVFWVVAMMIVAGEIWPVVMPGRSRIEAPALSVTTGFAALLYWGWPVAVLLRAAVTLAVQPAQKAPPHRVALSAAQDALSLAAAGAVLAALGFGPAPGQPWRQAGGQLPAVLAAAAAYFAAGFAIAAHGLALRSRTALLAVARQRLGPQALAHLMMLGAAPLMTVAMATGSAVMTALFAFPFMAVYVNAAVSVQREHQAHQDELTGLSNRKLLARRAAEALAAAAARRGKAGFLLLDLDRFKEVNDTLGHAVGDRLLTIVAHRLTHSVRPGDVVARLGGDEFAVLLPAVRTAAAAREVASRLRAALAEPVRLDAIMLDIEASVGIAIYPDDAASFDQLMQRADVAMYLAKERRSGIERYSALADRNSAERLALTSELRGAIHRGQIDLAFQPALRLADGQVISMEALARWPHPTRGTLPAADFVDLAEQSQLASELTSLILEKALAQAARWWAAGLRVQVSVNLPARDLLRAGLADMVRQALGRHGLPPGALRLDVSEHALASAARQAAGTIRALADLGVGLTLDDFGTGYSSLAQLTRLGVTEVKLDPALIAGLPGCPDQLATVRSLVRLAQSLGIRSVGEGVETDAAAAALRAIGCDGAQGWHIARPLSGAIAGRWLAGRLGGVVPGGELAGAAPGA